MTEEGPPPEFFAFYGETVEKSYSAKEKGSCDGPGACSAEITFSISDLRTRKTPDLNHKFRPEDLASEVWRVLRDKYDSGLTDTRTLRCHGFPLAPEKTLATNGVLRGHHVLVIVDKADGGMAMAPKSKDYTSSLRVPKARMHIFEAKYFPDLKTTDKPDDLMHVAFAKDPRVVAPKCKHAFTGETYFQCMKFMLRKDLYSHILICPVIGCAAEIPFDFVKKAAMLTKKEIVYYGTLISERAVATKVRRCPTCRTLSERPKELDHMRVRCVGRSCGDWCFLCGQKWSGYGFQVCGNTDCQTYHIKVVVEKAPEITLEYSDAKCPSVRACPKCLMIIEWQKGCKHMKCPKCAHYFCFLCLKKATGEGTDVCKIPDYKLMCELAPRQIIK